MLRPVNPDTQLCLPAVEIDSGLPDSRFCGRLLPGLPPDVPRPVKGLTMRFSLLNACRVAAVFGALAISPVALAQTATFNDQQRQEIGGIVKDYLLKNPEILQEVMAE